MALVDTAPYTYPRIGSAQRAGRLNKPREAKRCKYHARQKRAL